MTAKNKIILSVIAIFTTLVVAGSMVFIIFAATRGQITGGVTFEYHYENNYQLYGKVYTRYTTTPLTNGFGNGGGDVLVKTTDGADYVEFKGWQDETPPDQTLELVDIDLSIENPWVIFEVRVEKSQGYWWGGAISLVDAKFENVEVLAYNALESQTLLQNVSPESLAEQQWMWGWGNGPYYGVDLTTGQGISGMAEPSMYYMIRVKDTTKEASFSGKVKVAFVNF